MFLFAGFYCSQSVFRKVGSFLRGFSSMVCRIHGGGESSIVKVLGDVPPAKGILFGNFSRF